MLAISFFVGAANGVRWHWELIPLAVLLFVGYSLRVPLLAWIQRRRRDALPWAVGYALVAAGAFLFLLLHPLRGALLICLIASVPLFGLNLWFFARRAQRSVIAEFIGVIGLTFVSALGYYGAGGEIPARAGLLWFLNALYFGSSIFYVKLRIERRIAQRRASKRPEVLYRRPSLTYHLVTILLLLTLVFAGKLTPFVLLAFSPLLLRWWLLSRQIRLSFRQLGFTELGMSVVYAICLLWL